MEISVVSPCYGAPTLLRQLVEQITETVSKLTDSYEIILVEDCSPDNSREIIRDVLSADETYAVCLKEDNRAIGSIGLISPAQSHTAAKPDELEVGYWVGVPFWGRGLIPEALRRIVAHAFEDLGCSALWAGYYEGNTKSKRCLEKCGFHFHHTEENKPCELMGDVRTEHFTKLARSEWLSSK